MRAYITRGPGKIELVDLSTPTPGPEEVLVRIAYCSVCGSDITAYEGEVYRVPEGTILGHEVSGIVAGAGERVRDLRVGDRVALEPAVPCRRCWFCVRGAHHMCADWTHLGHNIPGGFADYVTIHELNAHRLPAGLALREAALLEPMGVCLAGLRKARLAVGETVAILGDGPFGAMFARQAVVMGARTVWVMGHHDWRLQRIAAPQVHTINTHTRPFVPALLADTEGRGVDVAVIAVGAPGIYDEIIPAVRAQGRVLAFSYPTSTVTLDMAAVHMRELEILGSCRCPHTFDVLAELIAQQRLQPAEFISAVLPLEELPRAFALARSGSKELFKILIQLADLE